MLTLEQCSKSLNKNNKKYTEKQVKEIREKLSVLADYILEMKQEQHENTSG